MNDLDEQRKLTKDVAQASAIASVPIFAPLAPAHVSFSAEVAPIIGKIAGYKAIEIPQTRSSQITLDGPPLTS